MYIKAVLKAARQGVEKSGKKVIAVMQPHRFTRLRDLFDDFCTCFNDADSVIIADVYPAGEEPLEGADKESLVTGILNKGHKAAQVLPDIDSLASIVVNEAEEGDFVICLGAGSISSWAYDLPAQLDKEFSKRIESKGAA